MLLTPPAEIGRKKKPGLLGAPRTAGGAWRGSPGPDAGYALTLAHAAHDRLFLTEGESAHDVEVGVALLAAKRAARMGRAPSRTDVDVAADIFGLRSRAGAGVIEDRKRRFAGLAESYAVQRALVDAVSDEVLAQSPGNVIPLVQYAAVKGTP